MKFIAGFIYRLVIYEAASFLILDTFPGEQIWLAAILGAVALPVCGILANMDAAEEPTDE